MKQYFLIRLDDACPTMDRNKWSTMEHLLNEYGIKPLVGIVPNCNDVNLKIDKADNCFWEIAKQWENKGWSIALHGNDHCYITKDSGINPMWNRSEFAGLSLDDQKEKIRSGLKVFSKNNIAPKYFFAPSHTFDENTIEALRSESNIRIISDTIGRLPYKKGDFWFIPQITGRCIKFPFLGFFTFCFHPNTMSSSDFEKLDLFLSKNHNQFIGFDDINLLEYKEKKIFDRVLSWLFFSYRSIRGLR